MSADSIITPERLRETVSYDEATGRFFWVTRPGDDRITKSWNTKYAGRECFTSLDTSGYNRSNMFGRSVVAHRAAWAIHYGEWPKGDVDHINRCKTDNRIENLRIATRSENCANASKKTVGSSSYKGVCWNAQAKKWQASIGFNGARRRIGLFLCEKDAALAYDRAAEEWHGRFASPNFKEENNVG